MRDGTFAPTNLLGDMTSATNDDAACCITILDRFKCTLLHVVSFRWRSLVT